MECGTSLWVFEINRLERALTDCVRTKLIHSNKEINFYSKGSYPMCTLLLPRPLYSFCVPFFCDNARKVKKARAIFSTYSSNFIGIKLAPGCLLVYSFFTRRRISSFVPIQLFSFVLNGKVRYEESDSAQRLPPQFFLTIFFF